MQRRFSTRKAWGIGLAVTVTLWAFLFAFCAVYFGANDDQFLLRTFGGVSPAGPSTFHLYWLAMYCFPMAWLTHAFPNVAWVSVLEIGLMVLGMTVIVKSIVQCFDRRGRGWMGVLFGVGFVLLLEVHLCARPTYTTAAATLSAACVAQVLSVDCETGSDKQILRGMGFALVLLVLCYGLRQMVSLPAMAFAGVAFLHRFFTCFWKKRNLKPLVITAIAVVGVMGALAVAREAEITARGQRDYLAWQQARISVLDYINLEALTPEERETLGWSDTQVTLLDNWYTMEEAISTENYRYIAENCDNERTRTSPGAAILDFRTRSPWIALSLVVLFGLGAACVLGLWLRKKGLWTFLALLCTAGGCLALLAYLALQGRLPFRAVMVPVLPAAAMVFCLAAECLPRQRWFTACLCTLLAVGALVCAVPTVREVWYHEPKWDYNTHAAMDQIAVENPDLLFIYSNELVNDMRMFPDFSNGKPVNLMFWGGWQRGSPEYIGKVEAFGLDSDHFTPADWLNPALRYLTLETEPHPVLVQHLREALGDALTWEQEKMDIALYAYRFYLAE